MDIECDQVFLSFEIIMRFFFFILLSCLIIDDGHIFNQSSIPRINLYDVVSFSRTGGFYLLIFCSKFFMSSHEEDDLYINVLNYVTNHHKISDLKQHTFIIS